MKSRFDTSLFWRVVSSFTNLEFSPKVLSFFTHKLFLCALSIQQQGLRREFALLQNQPLNGMEIRLRTLGPLYKSVWCRPLQSKKNWPAHKDPNIK